MSRDSGTMYRSYIALCSVSVSVFAKAYREPPEGGCKCGSYTGGERLIMGQLALRNEAAK